MQTVSAGDYHDIVQVSDPQLSPDGERVAFVRTVPDDDEAYEATVYVVPLGGDEPRQFTVAEGVDAEPRWSPSGDRLAFVSSRGADDDRTQLWILPTDGGEARQVTNVVGGVSDIAWSPDGTRIAFTQRVSQEDREEGRDVDVPEEYEPDEPDPRVVDRMIYRAHQRYFDGTRSHVYCLDLDTEEIEALTEGEYDFVAPEWGDEHTLYYAVKRGDEPDDHIRFDIDALDLPSGESETVTETTGYVDWIAATEDGRIAYPYTPEDRASLRQSEIRVLNRETDEEVTPTEPLDRTVLGAPEWGPNDELLYVLAPDEGSYTIHRVPADASAEPTFVLGDAATIDGFSVGEDAIAYVESDWDHRGDVFAATLGGAETSRLTRVNDEYLDGRAIAQPEEIRFESESPDGEVAEIQGWVLTPPDFDPEETYPLVVEIHGGPHAMWTTSGTMWHEFQTLAAEGYVVFWSNPRGSSGYGEDFMSAIDGEWGDVTLADVLAGADEVCAREYVDEDEQYVTGGSFGGYMTAWTVGQTDRFRAAVSQRGVYDLLSFYGSTDAFKLIEWDFGALPWEEPEFLWERSPVAYAADVETPTLLIHSERDFRTPINTAEQLYLFLRKNGVETRLVRYPREGHELSRSGEPGHVVDRIERIVRWFDGYSAYDDAPPALERDPHEGLTMAEEDDEDSEPEE